MKKFLSIFIAVAMVLSFASAFGGQAAPIAKAAGSGAIVKIMLPDDGHQYKVDDTFYVDAVISNPTDSAMSGPAVIDPGLTAALAAGEVASKSITVPAHGVIDVWWKLQCTAAGDSEITVSFNGADDSITVHQSSPTKTKLKVTIIEQPDPQIPISTDFVVKAKVEAPLEDVDNVKVTISFDNDLVELTNGDPATWNLGHVYKGDTHIVTWNLHCKGNGTTTIKVSATGDGVLPTETTPDSFKVTQGEEKEEEGPFNVTLDAPEKVCTNCGDHTFKVTATVNNNTGHRTLDTHAEISIVSGSSTADFIDTGSYPLDQDLGTVSNSDTGIAEWHVLCHAEGDVVFKVHAYGWIDMNNSGSKDAGDTYVEDTKEITVQQKALITDITDAWTNNNPHVTDPELAKKGLLATVGDDVYVKAEIKNCTCIPYDHLTVSIFANDDVIPNDQDVEFAPKDLEVHVVQRVWDDVYKTYSEVEEYDVPINDENPNGDVKITSLCDCCDYIITWHLHCTAQSEDTIKVATFDNQMNPLDSDSFNLSQGTPPALTKVIEFYPGWYSDSSLEITSGEGLVPRKEYAVSQNWTVPIVVSNIGGRVAEDVYLTLGADGDFNPAVGSTNGHATLVYDSSGKNNTNNTPVDIDFSSGAKKFYLGDIGPGESVKLIFEAHCSGDANVTFYVPGDTVICDPDSVLVDGESLTGDSHIKFYDVNNNNKWDSGEPVVYDSDNSDDVSAGDTAISGTLPDVGESLADDSRIKFYDVGGTSGAWDSGEPVVYDEDNLGTYNKRGLRGTDPLTGDPILASLIYNVPNEDTIKQIPIEVKFINPTSEEHFQMSTKFGVKVSITNWSNEEELKDVVVTLHWGSELGKDDHEGAELWQGSENPKTIPLITADEISEVSWEMHCNAPGDVYFWIEIKPGNTDLYIPNSYSWDDSDSHGGGATKSDNYVKITQDPETTLKTTIISPIVSEDCYLAYASGEDFAITAKVKNTGAKDATNVNVFINFGDYSDYFEVVEEPAQLTFPVLKSQKETPLLTWTLKVLKADAPPVSKGITVTAKADNANVIPASITVWPYPAADLKVEITPLANDEVNVGDDFDFTVKVTNIGWADAYDVWAKITLPDNVALQPGNNDTKIYIGTLQGHGGELNSKEVTFKLQCEGAGKSRIEATAYGKDEYGYTYTCDNGFALNPGAPIWLIDDASYTFEQVLPEGPSLTVATDVYSPTQSRDITVTYSATGGTEPYTFAAKVDDGAWVSQIPADSYTFHGLADGAHTLYIKVTDANGKYYIGFVNVVVDTTAPTGSVVINGGAAKTNNTDVTLDVSATDPHGPIEYSLDDSTWSTVPPNAATLSAGDGTKTVTVYFKDALGNESSASDTIELDTTAPSVSITTPGTVQAQTTFTMAYGSAASDVAFYEVKLNDGSWIRNELNTTYTFTGLVDGDNYLYVRATDDIGNVGDAASIIVTVNTELPTVTIDPVTSPTTLNYGTITYSATGGVPPYTYRVRVNNGDWTDWSSNTSFDYMGLVEGTNVIAVEAKDSLGKTGTANVSIVVDTTAPPAPSANPVGGVYNAEQTVTLSDAESGVSIYYTTDGTIPTTASALYSAPITIGEGITVLKAIAVDAAGNVSDVMTEIYNINIPSSQASVTLNLIDGWNLISVPFETSTSNLGTNVDQIYEWNGTVWAPVSTLEPGVGYLIHHSGSETITLSGAPTAAPFTIAANGTWQLIGDPFEVAVPWSGIDGVSNISMAFYWDGTVWQPVNLATDSMQPGVGYLILTSNAGNLTFQRP